MIYVPHIINALTFEINNFLQVKISESVGLNVIYIVEEWFQLHRSLLGLRH